MAVLATSKVLLILGATLAGSVLVKNGTTADFLGDSYKVLMKHLKNEGENTSQKSSIDSRLLAEINTLRQRLSELASENSSITLVTGSKSKGSIIYVVIPAFLIGVTGFGILRWKGLSLSDCMYVTRRSMSNAVASVSKQLEQVSTALTSTKRHLSSRLEHLSTNFDQNMELQSELKTEVSEVRGDVRHYGVEIETVQKLVQTLGVKIETIENKQDIANRGVVYLCNFVEKTNMNQPGKSLQAASRPQLEGMPQHENTPKLESQPQLLLESAPQFGRSNSSFGMTGLKELESMSNASELDSGNESSNCGNSEAGPSSSNKGTRPGLHRILSAKFASGMTRQQFFTRS